jgi:hypothetical protein
MPLGWVAAAGVVGSLVASDAAGDAADVQAGAARDSSAVQKQISDQQIALQREQFNAQKALEREQFDYQKALQREQFDYQKGLQAPFQQAGVNALGRMQGGEFAPPGAFKFQTTDYRDMDYQTDPGYAFRLAEGQKALDRQAAARGGLISGGALKAAARYGQEMGSQEFQNAYQRAMAQEGTNYNRALTGYNTEVARSDTGYNRLAAMAGVGQTATDKIGAAGQTMAAGLGSAGQAMTSGIGAAGQNMTSGISNSLGNYGNAASDAYMGAANARASGYVGGANALNASIGNIGNMYMQNKYMNQRFPSPVGATPGYGVGTDMSQFDYARISGF